MHADKVFLVFKTHFDIGFTALAEEVLKFYSGEMLEKVIDTCEATQSLNDMRYVWTVPAWPLQVMERDCAPELRERLQKLIENGQLTWHALPFTSHYDFSGLADAIYGLGYAKALSEAHGKPLMRAGKLTDVPGAGWMVPEILAEAGIRFLHMGCNQFATPPEVPELFWWEAPSGKRVLVMYSKAGYGTGLCPPENWPYPVWMALLNTQDNHGPQSAGMLEDLIQKAHEQNPGAQVLTGTLDDFWEALSREDLANVPVVRKDLADTWIHGIGSYPREVSLVRRLRPRLVRAEAALALSDSISPEVREEARKDIQAAYENLALFAEHTWGLDVKTHLGAIPDYDRAAFEKYREGEACRKMEASWAEQSDRAMRAVLACERVEKALSIGQPADIVPFSGKRCLDGILESSRYRLEFDPERGIITGFYDKARGSWLLTDRDGRGAVHYRYDRYGAQDMTEYLRAYAHRFSDWGVMDNGRIEYPECGHETWYPAFEECLRDGDTVRFRYRTQANTADAGDAGRIELSVTVPEDGAPITIRVHLKDKPATPYVESGELVLGLAAERARYLINKPGCVLDPEADIAPGANHVFYALEYFASARLASAQIAVVSRDCPLMSIGENGVYGYRRDFQETPPEMRFTLFNNMWGTNFPQWIEGDFSYEFQVFSLDRDDPDGAYEMACDLCDEPTTDPLPFMLPDGVRLIRLIPDEDGLILLLHNVRHASVRGELSFPDYALRREDLLGRSMSEWASERISLDLKAYGIACCRARATERSE